MRFISVIFFFVLASPGIADTLQVADNNGRFLAMRLNLSYKPTISIEPDNSSETSEAFDFTGYKIAVDYQVSKLIAIGPAFEYLNKEIERFGYYQNEGLSRFELTLSGKLNHHLTDTGRNYLVFGIESGYGSIKEKDGDSGNGYMLAALIGLDIALSGMLGLDFIYRYQYSGYKVDDINYRFDGSALQVGLNYRFVL